MYQGEVPDTDANRPVLGFQGRALDERVAKPATLGDGRRIVAGDDFPCWRQNQIIGVSHVASTAPALEGRGWFYPHRASGCHPYHRHSGRDRRSVVPEPEEQGERRLGEGACPFCSDDG